MATVAQHYEPSDLLARVTATLDEIAPDGRTLTLDELNGFDHFHSAGFLATVGMADYLAPDPADTVLDAGAGLGGPARYLADRFGCRVIGVDLTPVFIDVGRLISDRTGFADLVDLRVGDITALELDDGAVDHAWSQHVAMNIADRPALYAELRRVLKPGGRLALFDVIDGGGGELLLPVPWASEPEHSHLVTREDMRSLLEDAGFRVDVDEDPADELLPAMQRALGGGPPPSGPTMAMVVENIETKGPTYLQNIKEGRTALALMVCTAT